MTGCVGMGGPTKQRQVGSTTEITQNKYVKVLHYFVIDGMGPGHCFAQGPIMLLRRQHTMYNTIKKKYTNRNNGKYNIDGHINTINILVTFL